VSDVLVVGPASKESGGIAQYIAGQMKHFNDAELTVHDTAPRDGSGPVWLLLTMIGALFDAVRYAVRSPPDAAHIHTSHGLSFIRASFYVLFTNYVWRRPVALHIHGSSFDEFIKTESSFLRWYQNRVFDATSRVIVLSSYWKGVLSTPISSKKIKTIPNAINPAEYDPKWHSSVPHVVFISNLIERKGIGELIEAIRRIDRDSTNEYRVTIAGDGPLSSDVEKLATDIDYVDYRGFISEKEKRSILESGGIYVLPSHAEGLPIAILEGMAGGNAIISTTVGSIPEVVTEDIGITVNPKEVDELESALRELIDDSERTAQMGRHSRKLCEEQYSWEFVTSQLKKVYIDCINGGYSA
jgi:glycosyltransferase involved in cell wall biosynthesis